MVIHLKIDAVMGFLIRHCILALPSYRVDVSGDVTRAFPTPHLL